MENHNLNIKCPIEKCFNKQLTMGDIEMYIDGHDLERYFQIQRDLIVQNNQNKFTYCLTPDCGTLF